jgi:c-di-GMP-binding flagellar brake protein YcgR
MSDIELFRPGKNVRLIALTTIKSKLTAHIIGASPGRFLAVEPPSVGGVSARLEKGSNWNMNFIHQGEIINCSTQVVGHSRQVFPLVFLSYPDEIQRARLRSGPRYPVSLDAKFQLLGPQGPIFQPSHGRVLDISSGGCLVQARMPLSPGQLVELSLHLKTLGWTEGLTGEVANSRNGDDGLCEHGLSFGPCLNGPAHTRMLEYVGLIESLGVRV